MAKEAEVGTEIVTKDPIEEGNQHDESVVEDVPEIEDSEAVTTEPLESKEAGKAKVSDGKEAAAIVSKTVYTPEELEELLQSEGEVDTSRLSSEGKALMKSFQRGMDKKFQQLAEMRRSVEAQSKPQDPREQLFARYMSDPGGVIAEVNVEIENLEGIDPTEPKYGESRRTIARLQALKDEFSIKRQSVIEHGRQTSDIVSTTQMEIVKAIPDFETKAPKLTKFAQEMGLTLREVQALTDPTVTGPMALKLTKVINAVYDKINAPKSAEAKVVKEAPAPLQRGGGGKSLETKTDEDPGAMPMPKYLAWRKKNVAE